MKTLSKYLIAGATAALVCGTTVAQQSQPQQDQQQQQQRLQQSSSQSSSQSQQPWEKARKQEFFRASKIVEKETQVQGGQNLGKLTDLIFNQKGEIFALVGIGNSKLAVVPWEKFNPRSAKGDQPLVIESTAQAIASAPAVTEEQWGAVNNEQFLKGIYAYYKVQPPGQQGMGGSSSTGEEGSTSTGQGSSSGSSQQQQKSLSEKIDKELQSESNEIQKELESESKELQRELDREQK